MDRLTSRKNALISHMRKLGADRAYRNEQGEFLCDGEKLLHEALLWGAEITAILWSGEPERTVECPTQFLVDPELLNYVSPLKNAASVVFSVRIEKWDVSEPGRTLVLETLQDPGNLGTILRTANALGVDTVILTGDCADVYNPKTIRAAMGATFRQRWTEMERKELRSFLDRHGFSLFGAALSERSTDIREANLRGAAVAIGSEGRGLSEELLELCDGEIIIPMRPTCESLNAAIAASIIMWELDRQDKERG